MKPTYIVILAVVLSIGLAPYIASIFSYRGASGYVGMIGGVQYDWVFVDRTHYQSPKVLIYPDHVSSSVGSHKLAITLDGQDVEFGEDKVLLLTPDKSVVRLGWNKKWFVTSSDYGSHIFGLFGHVPHFKDYQIEYPDSEQIETLIETLTRDNVMHEDTGQLNR